MRILTISNFYPPHHFGGYELSCHDVMRRLAARGHEITVLTSDVRVREDDPAPERGQDGVRRELAIYWDDHILLSPPVARRWSVERANQRALRAAILAANPEVVSVWNMGAMSLGLLRTISDLGIPMVLAVCDDWLVYGPRLDAWHRLFSQRPLLGRAVEALGGPPTRFPELDRLGAFCFVSDFTRRRAEEANGRPFSVATVVYSGIERSDFAPAAPSGMADWRWRLLYVGRVDDRKGIETLIASLTLLPAETTLEIIGRGDPQYLRRLHELAAADGLAERVRFDSVDRAELAHRYRQADVCVFPSEWDEPFGLVPLEAMACGTPVVATGTGGSAEFLVDGGNCLRFARGDASDLAGAICRLAGDPALRLDLRERGLQTAAELDTDRLADAFEAWHLAALDGFTTRPPDRRPIDPSARA